ncbi:hypothetical protein [Rhodanobacter sp. L36]|uniref:hypothetical protein n=1 Tax=Rhodanobacter sp. L36 TaxID=1747221 RepID=UPI00131AC552|nr:hypothetical protein [Rhodanobacter sp. L36]
MWPKIHSLITSLSPWALLVIGAVVGATLSTLLSIRSNRPRLIISGGGGGGTSALQGWNITILNKPAFLGIPFAGEAAKDVSAWLRQKARNVSYPLLWDGLGAGQRATIDAGQTQSLQLFAWFSTTRGKYFLLDHAAQPVAEFDAAELKFVLRLVDRFSRSSEFSFIVKFDDSSLQNPPQLSIVHPMLFSNRVQRIRRGLHLIRTALWART